jgi:hypothetical protein
MHSRTQGIACLAASVLSLALICWMASESGAIQLFIRSSAYPFATSLSISLACSLTGLFGFLSMVLGLFLCFGPNNEESGKNAPPP